ncbi:MAG: hypothetical protein RI947_1509 [Candidatus Parcubacteria bacterium]|jgi:putative endonuclease
MWYFYILQSTDDQDYFYKGSTNDLRRRFQEHNQGEVMSTKSRKPWKLVYYEAYISEKAARCRESAVKKSGSISVPLLRRIKESLCYNLEVNTTDNRKLQTQQNYSKINKLYADDFGKDYDHFDFIDLVINHLSQNKLEKLPIIDLGAGSGVVTDYLIEKGQQKVTAIDITPEFCGMIRQKHKNKVHVVCEDMVEAIKNQQSSSIGAYIANYSIIHIPEEEVDSMLSNIARSLFNQGLFLMSCHKGTYKGMEQEPYQSQNDSRLNEQNELSTYMNYFMEDELKQRVEHAGLVILKMDTFETKIVPGEIPVPKIWLLAKKV